MADHDRLAAIIHEPCVKAWQTRGKQGYGITMHGPEAHDLMAARLIAAGVTLDPLARKDANRWRRALETAIPWLEAANAETFHSSELAAMALGFRRALGPDASSIPWDGVTLDPRPAPDTAIYSTSEAGLPSVYDFRVPVNVTTVGLQTIRPVPDAALREAAQAMVDWFNSPPYISSDQEYSDHVAALRAALEADHE